MSTSNLLVTQQDAVLTLSLNRAHHGNRISATLAQQLREACQRANRDDGVRAVVLTGQGSVFCLGSDLDLRVEARANKATPESLEVPLDRHTVAGAVAAVTRPVIVAINGDALDQGLELALACDLRMAAAGARLGFPQVVKGVLPWDGGSQRLPRTVGRGAALELLLTGRTVTAEEGCRLGLVHQVRPREEVLATAHQVAAHIASQAPLAARYAKEAVLTGLDLTLNQGLRLEADLNFILQGTRDRAEGIRSFLERRAPEYRGE